MDDTKIQCVKLLPNFLMNSALTIKRIDKAEEAKTHNEDIEYCINKINDSIENGEI